MKSLVAAAVLFLIPAFSQAQQISNLCFPVGSVSTQAARHGEYPAFSLRDNQYRVTFTLYINPKTGSYTMMGVADINPEVECVASIGTDFKPIMNKPKGMPL